LKRYRLDEDEWEILQVIEKILQVFRVKMVIFDNILIKCF
jgi:hypothetical protein